MARQAASRVITADPTAARLETDAARIEPARPGYCEMWFCLLGCGRCLVLPISAVSVVHTSLDSSRKKSRDTVRDINRSQFTCLKCPYILIDTYIFPCRVACFSAAIGSGECQEGQHLLLRLATCWGGGALNAPIFPPSDN